MERSKKNQSEPTRPSWMQTLYDIVFEADTKAGKRFDIALLWAILLSVTAVMFESVTSIKENYGQMLRGVEWFFTVIFTIEYIIRIVIAQNRFKYVSSLYGLIDLLSVAPTYLSIFLVGTQSLLVIRIIRLLRVFRILKLVRHIKEAQYLMIALKRSRAKITVFLGAVLSLAVILGTVMYLVEGSASGFTSIPRSIYWSIVTLTTVGYGDIAPATIPGQMIAAVIMILGYSIIAVPTGIVTAQLSRSQKKESPIPCPQCGFDQNDDDADFCKKCGAELEKA